MTKVRSSGQRMKYAIKKAGREWTAWNNVAITDQMRREHKHLAKCSSIYANSRFEVQCWECASPVGGFMHAIIARHGLLEPVNGEDIQRIKAELFGPNVVGVEIYPPVAAGLEFKTRHLWILPTSGYSLPFGFDMPTCWGQ